MTGAEVLRVLAVFERCDLGGESLMWKIKGEDEAWLGMLCNDVFYWATADVEEITPEDFDLLDSCVVDLKALDAAGPYATAETYLPELFCSRKRGMRPQTPWGRKRTYASTAPYSEDSLDPRLRALFDARGPRRDPKDERMTRVNDKTPDGFDGWDGRTYGFSGGVPGDPYFVQALTSYDGPVSITAWSCKVCGALVVHDSLDLHRGCHMPNGSSP